MNTENRDNLIRLLGNLIEDSKNVVEIYDSHGYSYRTFHVAIKSLKETVLELNRTYIE